MRPISELGAEGASAICRDRAPPSSKPRTGMGPVQNGKRILILNVNFREGRQSHPATRPADRNDGASKTRSQCSQPTIGYRQRWNTISFSAPSAGKFDRVKRAGQGARSDRQALPPSHRNELVRVFHVEPPGCFRNSRFSIGRLDKADKFCRCMANQIDIPLREIWSRGANA